MSGTEDTRAGRFTAVFPNSRTAGRFFDRLTSDPDGEYAEADSIKRNRANGKIVTWTSTAKAFQDHLRDSQEGIFQHWADLCELVGYYGSTSGEPPWGAGAKTAFLNGRQCPPSY